MREAASRHAGWFAARIGYDEATAHRIQAGADMFLMPRASSPAACPSCTACVTARCRSWRRVGGLADTVANADPERLA